MLQQEGVGNLVFRFCQHALRKAKAATGGWEIRAHAGSLAGMRCPEPPVDSPAAKCALSVAFFPREMRA